MSARKATNRTRAELTEMATEGSPQIGTAGFTNPGGMSWEWIRAGPTPLVDRSSNLNGFRRPATAVVPIRDS